MVTPFLGANAHAEGLYGTADFSVSFTDPSTGAPASPWHDVPLQDSAGNYRFIVEIPMYQVC